MAVLPAEPRVLWFEVWVDYDGEYFMVLRALSDGTFVLYDPQTKSNEARVFGSYEDAEQALSEDEFRDVDGRMVMTDGFATQASAADD